MKKNIPKIVIVLGPTASGKSDLGVALAKKFNGEIISADSRQVYKHLNIGTGKISEKEMRGIPHHLLDIANPRKQTSVAEYYIKAKSAIEKIIQKKKIPIIVGGTGLYIDAIIYGAPYPEVPPNISLRKRLEKYSAEKLFKILQKKDRRRAKTIDRFNKRRLIRTLEIIYKTKKPIPPLNKVPQYKTLLLGIQKSKKEIENRIDLRLEKRLRAGMIKEVQNLLNNGVSKKRLHDLGLEYRYISEYLDKKYSKKELTERLSIAIKQYAKRQMTWFRQYPNIHWIKNIKQAEIWLRKFISQN